jgi:hypothetical protein
MSGYPEYAPSFFSVFRNWSQYTLSHRPRGGRPADEPSIPRLSGCGGKRDPMANTPGFARLGMLAVALGVGAAAV